MLTTRRITITKLDFCLPIIPMIRLATGTFPAFRYKDISRILIEARTISLPRRPEREKEREQRRVRDNPVV